MLQAFYLDVAKVDIAYVAMAIYTYFKRIFQMFHLDVLKVNLVEHMLQCVDR